MLGSIDLIMHLHYGSLKHKVAIIWYSKHTFLINRK